MKKRYLLFTILLCSCSTNEPFLSSSKEYNSYLSSDVFQNDEPSSLFLSEDESSNSFISSENSNEQVINSSDNNELINSIDSSLVSSEFSHSSSEAITKKYDYLDGVLYGDDKFVEKCRQMKNREIESVEDIPSEALYVSNDGNDSNKGTMDAPFKTLSTALEQTKSLIKNNKRAVIIMREGVYEPTYFYSLVQGNEDNYVVITNYPGEEVKISPKDNGFDKYGLFHFGTSSYFIVEGLKFCDSIGTTVAKCIAVGGTGSSHIIFKHNEIYNIKVTEKKANAPLCSFRGNGNEPLNNILIYDNYIHDCVCGWSEAITMVGNVENSNIIQNKVTNTGNIGIDIAGNYGDTSSDKDQARNIVVRGNDVSNENSPNARSYAIYVDGAKDTIFENNVVYNSQGGIEIGSEEGAKHKDYPVKDIIVRNNVVYNNSEQGITIGGYNPSVAYYCENISVYNNTVVNNGEKDSGQLKISMVDGLNVYNNIFYSSDNYSLLSGELDEKYSKNVVLRNNIFYSGTSKDKAYFEPFSNEVIGFDNFLKIFDNAGFYVDPKFKDINSFDFSVLQDSYAIDNGYYLYVGDYDIDKNSRYINNLDIGAFEYQN